MLQSVARQDAEIALLRQRLLAISQTVSRMSDAVEKYVECHARLRGRVEALAETQLRNHEEMMRRFQ